jgi:hypothetical protein
MFKEIDWRDIATCYQMNSNSYLHIAITPKICQLQTTASCVEFFGIEEDQLEKYVPSSISG